MEWKIITVVILLRRRQRRWSCHNLTGIMPAMMIGVVDFDEEFASMKAMLERLSKESVKKDARIKRQEEQITKLLKKLDKGPRASSNRGASSDEDKKESNRSEASEDDDGSKKGGKPQNDSSLSAMTAEQIHELIANAVKTLSLIHI